MTTTYTTPRQFGISVQFPDNSKVQVAVVAASRRQAWAIARKEFEPQGLKVVEVFGY